jgi:hypothetical protein
VAEHKQRLPKLTALQKRVARDNALAIERIRGRVEYDKLHTVETIPESLRPAIERALARVREGKE